MAKKKSNAVVVKTSAGIAHTDMKSTRWSGEAASAWTEYPRPGMVRPDWQSLNGLWRYAFTASPEEPARWDGEIRVPFSPESVLSGVERQLKPEEWLWYAREVAVPAGRVLLHFGAVDQECAVFANGQELATHVGGYLPVTAELTAFAGQTVHLTVRVKDGSDSNWHSRGKQKLKRGGMYYTAQSGIWQTVWLERVPDICVERVDITPLYDESACRVRVSLSGGDAPVTCVVSEETAEMADWRDHPERGAAPEAAPIAAGEGCECTLPLPGFTPWTPEQPHLYRLTVSCGGDRVECYFGMRSCTLKNDAAGLPRLMLNHQARVQCGVLDQGYWPDGLYTAPCDEALVYDIRAMKDLGFDMLRKHMKLEPERWYYHCDRLGMLVWQDMVAGGAAWKSWFVTYLGTALNAHHIRLPDGPGFRHLLARHHREGREEFLREMEETVRTLYNHPAIVTWVLFNEGWGQFDAKRCTRLLRGMDGSRWIDQCSGWFDRRGGDMVSLHHYFFKFRFKAEQRRALVLSEFGGYSWKVPGHTFTKEEYGYGACDSSQALTDMYVNRWKECAELVKQGFCGFVYTQVSDVEDEANGLLTYDRELVKPDTEAVRRCCLACRDSLEK